MRQFKEIHRNLDIRVLFAIMNLQKEHDLYTMYAKFNVIGKNLWNEFINENTTLSPEQKKECIITNPNY